MSKFCPKCSAQLDQAANFCINCGTKFSETAPQQQPQTRPAPPPVRQQQPQQQYNTPQQPYTQRPQQPYRPQQQSQPYRPPQQPYTQQPPYTQQQQYIPPQQQPYPPQQPYAPAPAVPEKKKGKLLLILAIVGLIIVAIITGAVLLIVSTADTLEKTLANTTKADYYEIGSDQIPSVKIALGEERTVTGDSTSTENNTTTRIIKYTVSGTSQNEDMFNYLAYLCDNDDSYAILVGADFTEAEGRAKLIRNSADDGYIIQVQVEYDTTGYTVTLLKDVGEVKSDQKETTTTSPDNDKTTKSKDTDKTTKSPDKDKTTKPSDKDKTTKSSDKDKTTKPSDKDKSNSLTKKVFSTIKGGTYHMKMTVYADTGDKTKIEMYVKDETTAMVVKTDDMDMRMVYKDGKCYTVSDKDKTVMVLDLSSGGNPPALSDTPSMTFVRTGKGKFLGETYKYDEYEGKNGEQQFFYMDGETLKGIRTIASDVTTDFKISTFNKKIPDDIFDIPKDYEVVEK